MGKWYSNEQLLTKVARTSDLNAFSRPLAVRAYTLDEIRKLSGSQIVSRRTWTRYRVKVESDVITAGGMVMSPELMLFGFEHIDGGWCGVVKQR